MNEKMSTGAAGSTNLKSRTPFTILGISGSGRRRSYNTALLEAAREMLPEGVALERYDVARFPLYNEDNEYELRPALREFKTKIRAADAILIATPEYNYSVPAVLKNALEWGNRPEGDNSWEEKPAAIMSASTGPRGGARAQLVLRQIMVDLNMHPVNDPQLLISRAQEKFDRDLRLVDENSRETLRSLLLALLEWARRLNRGNAIECCEPKIRST